MQENFEPEFKLIIENLQEKLHQRNCKQSKGSKICTSIRWELEYEKYSNTFCKKLTKTNFLEKLNPKQGSSKSTIYKVLSKISNRKKTLKHQYNFCKAKKFLEVYGM